VAGTCILMQVRVRLSELPFEDQSPIKILPVNSDPTLDLDGTRLAELPKGAIVDLLGVDPAARSCSVDREAAQGW